MPNKFEYVKKGYDPDAVDRYINDLELIMRNYKDKDAVIANAIVNAQISADDITAKANVAADTIIQNARNMSYQIMETTSKQVDGLLKSVNVQRERIKTFQEDYIGLIRKYLHDVQENDIIDAERKLTELEAYLKNIKTVETNYEEETEEDEDDMEA